MTAAIRISERLAGRAALVIGRAGMDIYPVPDGTRIEDAESLVTDVGGSSGNIAVTIAKQHCPVMLMSAISNDGVGRYVTRALTDYGVDTRYCHMTTGLERTSLALAESTTDAPNVVIYRNDAADLAITPDHADSIDLATIGVIIITGTALSREPSRSACDRIMERAGDAGCPIVLDVDYRPQAWADLDDAARTLSGMAHKVDMLVANDEEFDVISNGRGREFADRMAASGVLTLYKMGEGGCDILTGDAATHIGIFRVDALKPFGSGDAFLGTIIASLADGAVIEDAVRRGAAGAALAVSRRGCAAAMPNGPEIDEFMSSRTIGNI
jgi:5-dehydro-2-deoxygluconokinase